MNFFRPARPLLLGWLVALVGWVALAFVVAYGLVASTPFTWIEAMQTPVREWLPWTLAAPLLFRLVDRLPIERERWWRPLLGHASALLCVAALAWAWARFLDIRPAPGIERFGGSMEQRFPRFEPQDDYFWMDDFSPDSGGPGRDGDRSGFGPPPPAGAASGGTAPRAGETGSGRGPGGPGGPLDGGGGPGAPTTFPRTLGRVLSTYAVLASVAHALLFYRRAKEREAGLARARLEALRMQLQPHFLFNTLNTKPDRADAVLTALGELLRLTLETSEVSELPLRDEMRFVEAYLAIMQARFEERVRGSLSIEPETGEALVPAFILQPLIENAVRHGLEPLPGGGSVEVRARREGDVLVIEVRDDGVGLGEGGPKREGLGLGNTRARLRELHGEHASLELRAGGERGCTVLLRLPFRTSA